MRTLLLAIGFSLLLSGCGAESDAKKAVLGSLKDPDSAKFGKFTQVEKSACLTVNARNSMGGYTGDQQATLRISDKEWMVSYILDESHDACISSIRQALERKRVLEDPVILELRRKSEDEKQAKEYAERQIKKHEAQLKEHDAQLKKCSEIKDCPSCPKIELKDCPDCFEMVVIPAGSFEMGETGSTHRVELKSFALGKTEVTQGQWRAVMGNNPSHFRNCGDNLDDSLPVEQVSWDDAKEFIQKLNTKTGKQYRLPTETEWEYACRAGVRQKYCGSDDVGSVAWYVDNSGHSTYPVGRKQANAWGLYDMSGNVWEWVEDIYDYTGAPTDGSARQGDGSFRVVRGGSWDNVASTGHYNENDVYADTRTDYEPDRRYGYIGFRVARTLP